LTPPNRSQINIKVSYPYQTSKNYKKTYFMLQGILSISNPNFRHNRMHI
jgi:hypothetical protein